MKTKSRRVRQGHAGTKPAFSRVRTGARMPGKARHRPATAKTAASPAPGTALPNFRHFPARQTGRDGHNQTGQRTLAKRPKAAQRLPYSVRHSRTLAGYVVALYGTPIKFPFISRFGLKADAETVAHWLNVGSAKH